MRGLIRLAALTAAFAFLVAASADTVVYITRTGECYHRGSCHHLRRSKIPITLREAVQRGYRPCKNCNPPLLDREPPKQEKKEEPKREPPKYVVAKLVSVTDGDTIRAKIEGLEYRVRLIGIDTPELHLDNSSEPEAYAEEAKAFLEAILKKRSIWLEYDVERQDKYERELCYLWAKGSKDKERILVNAQLLRQGLAVLMTIPPNVKYVERFTAAQKAARKDKLNLWSD